MIKKRILILTHNYPKTPNDRQNAGIFVHDLAEQLAKKAEVFVLCPNIAGKKEVTKSKVSVTWFNWRYSQEKLGDWKWYQPTTVIKFAHLIAAGNKAAEKMVQEKKIDVCIAMWAIPAGIWGRHIFKKFKIPYLIFSLGSDIDLYPKFPLLKPLIKKSLADATLRFAVSHKLADKTTKLAGKDCNFMPIMTDFTVNAVKKRKLSPDFNFIYVGRLEKVKGLDLLIEAANLLNRQQINFHLYILGDGSMKNFLINEMKKNHLEKNVTLFGSANKEEVISFMKSANSLILSSRSEGLSLVIIEAANAGLPVVTTNVGEGGPNVKNYNLGFVSEEISAESIAKTMKKAITTKNFGKNQRQGMKKISEDFNVSHTAKKLLDSINLI